jgi:acetyltransferase-like isoleucine patch superfamily enzyme
VRGVAGADGVKAMVKALLWRPGRTRYGPGSYIQRPVHLEGAGCISLGARVLVKPHGYLAAIERWGKGEGEQRMNPRIEIGDDAYIGGYVYMVAMEEISIGPGCVLAEQVFITDLEHGMDPRAGLIMQQPLKSKGPVRIGEGCFLGYRAVVLPGVTLGPHCVVAAQSVVTASFEEGSMIAGNPARIGKRWDGEQWK